MPGQKNQNKDMENTVVKVFKTNINCKADAQKILSLLELNLHPLRVTVDLEDCDKVLRVESASCAETQVISLVNSSGFQCALLPF